MGNGRRLGTLALAVVLAGGLAACGDDDDEDTGLEEVGDGGGDESGDDNGGDDESSDTTIDIGDIEGLSGECEIFAQAAIAFGAAFSGDESADFGDLGDAMQEFADEAPDEIRDDLEILAEAYGQFDEEFGDIDFTDPEAFSDPEVQARLAEAGEIFNSAEVTEANENLSAFTEENCSGAG